VLTVHRPDTDPSRQELAALELQVAEREAALAAFKVELQQLQSKYLSEVGALYADLAALDAAIRDEEVRRGIRPPADSATDTAGCDAEEDDAREEVAGCGNRAAPSSDLKRMFRELARTIHPDLAADETARYRRHSLMAEANRAYAERDADRLRLILRTWERSPEAILGDDPEADRERLRRRLDQLRARLAEVDAEAADLRDSAIARLKRKLDAARDQGWDLFAEMIRHVQREAAASRARLASLRR
jgi:hypothetical protein